MNQRTLNVKKITKGELRKQWGIDLPLKWPLVIYIRCNAKGEVKWNNAPVYMPAELINRKHKIH